MTKQNPALLPRKQPRQARSQATVTAILQAAAHILETRGLPAFTTNAVAEKAGVSIGSLYQYFPGREALLAALIREKRSDLLETLQAAAQGAEGENLKTLLRALVCAGIESWQKHARLNRSLSYAELLLPMDHETLKLKRSVTKVLADALEAHDVDDAHIAARDLAAMTYGMIDAAGVFGPNHPKTLEARILRAAIGYFKELDGENS